METVLLQTKLYTPQPRPNLVSRPHLVERLNEGLYRKLILISAPAGFGKTTLISNWISELRLGNEAENKYKGRVAWVSLDEDDNDPARFLAYILGALQTLDPNLGTEALHLLQSPQPMPIQSVLTSLINDVAATNQNFILVLDDYHGIETKSVDDLLAFLLDHMPPQMRLVIISRSDPLLPLARLRGRGELIELRASDLRFTATEAAAFLNHAMGLSLTADEIAALETRTEGWIVGLQMAALSMQGHTDIPQFIEAFSGDNRYIVDYLVEEVMQRQPEQVRSFLLQTAILDRLNGPLCNAVTRRTDGQDLLETLERDNLFVVPLDDQRQWYRYHHLFAEVLRARTIGIQTDQIPTLHLRASTWYEQNDFLPRAIHHALAGKDFERAAGFIEQVGPAMESNFQSATLLSWLKALPDALIRVRPILCVGYAWALTGSNDLEAGETRLQEVKRWLEAAADLVPDVIELSGTAQPKKSDVEVIVTDQAQFQALPTRIAIIHAYLAQAHGDIASAIQHARQALELSPDDDKAENVVPTSILAMAYWANGDLGAAYESFAGFSANFQQAGNIAAAISGTSLLADILIAQGRLLEAMNTYQQSLKLVMKQKSSIVPGLAELYVGLSELHCERGDMESATQNLLQYEALDERAAITGNAYRLYPAIARIKAAQGDLDGALTLLDKAEQVYYKTPVPDVRPIAAQKVRVWLKQGRLAEALGWMRERGLSLDGELSYLNEFEYLTFVRVRIAQYRRDLEKRSIYEASGLLERLLKAAEAGNRPGSVIEVLTIQALVSEAQGDIPIALKSLERALTLAEPEGYVRIFVDEGLPMATLLTEITKHNIAPAYVRQLQIAVGSTKGRLFAAQYLIDPLSERELDVLRLLTTDLTGPQIAQELMVSLNTIRTHTKNIYHKLGVNTRRAAIRQATEYDLL
ncbi:MAG: LuxR C-terminal-related transcriptional regulator [Chloroflexota bacterium]